MRDEVEKLPIFKKGKEIFDLVHQIGDLIPEDDDHLQSIKGQMFLDAGMLSAKVAAAEGGDIYDLRMECAAIIRKSARDLMVQNHSLRAFGFEHVEYYDLVRELIEEYRLLFIDWVQSFDPWNYIHDSWGLFNPPGVGPFDNDPDDDVPFHPDE